MDGILGSKGTSTIACPATNATLIVEYGATVSKSLSPGAAVSVATVTFTVSNLEDNPMEFEVVLKTCHVSEPFVPVVSIVYNDDQGNTPDFKPVLNVANGSTCPTGMAKKCLA